MGDNAIGILIESRNQALAGIRETTVALSQVPSALAPIAPAAAISSQALERASLALADVSAAARGLQVGPQLGQLTAESRVAGGALDTLGRIAESFNAHTEQLRGGLSQSREALDQVSRAAARAGDASHEAAAGFDAGSAATQVVAQAAQDAAAGLQAAGQGADIAARAFQSQAEGGRDAGRSIDELQAIAENFGNAAGRITGGILEASAGLDDLVRAAVSAGGATQESGRDIQASAVATQSLRQATEASAAALDQEAAASSGVATAARVKAAAEQTAASVTRQHAAVQRELAVGSKEGAVGLLAVREVLSDISPQAAGAAGQLERVVLLLGRLPLEAAVFTGIGIAAAAAGGGILAMGESLAKEVQELENLNRATGASIDNLQVLKEVLKQSGLSFDTILTPLTNLNREIAQGNPLLKTMGITAREPVEALLQLSRALAGSTDEQSKAEIVARLLGGRSRELLAVISDLAAKFPEARAELERFGALIGADTIPKADALRDATNRLGADWSGVWKEMREVAVPAGSAIVTALQLTINHLKDMAAGAREAGDAVMFVVHGLEQLGTLRDPSNAPGALVGPPAPDPNRGPPETPGAFIGPVDPAVLAQWVRDSDARKTAEEAAAAAAKRHAEAVRDLESTLPFLTAAEAEAAITAKEFAERHRKAEEALNDFLFSAGPIPEEVKRGEKAVNDFNAKLNETSRLTGLSPAVIEGMLRIGDASKTTAKELEAGASQMESFREKIEALSNASGLSPVLVASIIQAREEVSKAIDAFTQLGQLPPVDLVRKQRAEEHDLQFQQRAEEIADPGRIKDVADQWTLSMADIMSTATILQDTMQGVFGALESSFTTVFQNLFKQGQTFASAMKSIFTSMVNAILAELARLAASALFSKLIALAVGFFTGGPGGAVVGGGFAGGVVPHFEGATPAPGETDLGGPAPASPGPRPLNLSQVPAAAAAAAAIPTADAMAQSIADAIAESRAITGSPARFQASVSTAAEPDDLRRIGQSLAQILSSMKNPAELLTQSARIALTPPPSRPQDNVFGAAQARAAQATPAPAPTPQAKEVEKRVIEQHITIQIDALDAKSVTDYFSSPLGKGRLAEVITDASNGF